MSNPTFLMLGWVELWLSWGCDNSMSVWVFEKTQRNVVQCVCKQWVHLFFSFFSRLHSLKWWVQFSFSPNAYIIMVKSSLLHTFFYDGKLYFQLIGAALHHKKMNHMYLFRSESSIITRPGKKKKKEKIAKKFRNSSYSFWLNIYDQLWLIMTCYD